MGFDDIHPESKAKANVQQKNLVILIMIEFSALSVIVDL